MITALFAAAALSTAPSAPEPIATVQTRVDELATRFGGAQLSTRERLAGWFSGRCYLTSNPNVAFGNALLVETRNQPSNEGPIFDRPVTKIMVVGRGAAGAEAPADFYDNMNADQYRETQAYADTSYADPNLSEAYVYDYSLSSDNRTGNIRYDVRSDQDYHFVRAVNLATGAQVAYCYFFKKIK